MPRCNYQTKGGNCRNRISGKAGVCAARHPVTARGNVTAAGEQVEDYAARFDPLGNPKTSMLGLSTDVPEVLPVEINIWYRLHWKHRPWETGDAAVSVAGVAESHSERTQRYEDDLFYPGRARGYSCLSDPRTLVAYVYTYGWDNLEGFPDDHRVVMFEGEQVGNGADGEPTVRPYDDASTAVEMSWEDLVERVESGRVHLDRFNAMEMDPEGYGVSVYGHEDPDGSPRAQELHLLPFRSGWSDEHPWWCDPEA